MASIPENHTGIHYTNWLAALSQKRGFRRYLEIGVNEGLLMSLIHADIAVGIDPEFIINRNIAAHKKAVHLIQVTSDHFFSSKDLVTQIGGAPAFSFLDGFHTFEYLLRDFMNTESISNRTSIIGMHDCLPLDEVMTERDLAVWRFKTVGTRHENSWTGDVWKVVLILKKYRPDLKLHLVDCPPTGVVCITRLDPLNTFLRDNYIDIIEEFVNIPNKVIEIEKLYDASDLTSSASVLKNLDHSLFFNT